MREVAKKISGRWWRQVKFVLITFAFLTLAIAGWGAYDLYAPRRSQMRDFDPIEVGRLETAMWRSYYERKQLSLFSQLAKALRSQYKLPLVRSNTVAYRAAYAAFIFKDGHSRTDYEKALPDLTRFYDSIREVSDIDFDPARAAKLELEWWIIHRERARHQTSDLVDALAELQAEIYRVPIENVREHARLRADAMLIRDKKAEAGGVSENDWNQINELLKASWESLHNAVNVPGNTASLLNIGKEFGVEAEPSPRLAR